MVDVYIFFSEHRKIGIENFIKKGLSKSFSLAVCGRKFHNILCGNIGVFLALLELSGLLLLLVGIGHIGYGDPGRKLIGRISVRKGKLFYDLTH